MVKNTTTAGTKSEGSVIPFPEKQYYTMFSNTEKDTSVFIKDDWATSID